jgi:class 3 adenylate cyclase
MSLEMACPACGKANPPGSRFCGGCGQSLAAPKAAPNLDYSHPNSYTPRFLAEKILTSRSSVEGERKIVTVLFADVVNFTSMSEKLDPEKIQGIMDDCFKILMDEVHRYEGTVNQFLGDGVMALFGAPLAHEDHGVRACHAALAIQQALGPFAEMVRQEHSVEFRMRTGLNSGPVVVGTIGDDLRMDYTAVGDTVNLASRIQGLAEAGTTYVSEETHRLAQGMFDFEALGKRTVKGKAEAVPIYRLHSLKPESHRPRPGAERAIYSKMVGRDVELKNLELQVMKAVNGKGSVVNIIGEAGIGKSRLVAELKIRDAMKWVRLLEGRAISIGRNLSYHPIVDLLKQWMGARENDDPGTTFDRLQQAVRDIAAEEADELVPFVATLMGIPLWGRYAERVKGLEGEALERLILKSLRDLLVRGAERTPLVIVMEDLHWADTTSIELLESLFRLAQTQRILFLNLFRPGFTETGERIRNALKEKLSVYHLDMFLGPLDEQACRALIGGMLSTWQETPSPFPMA